jgi:hypothetical protein
MGMEELGPTEAARVERAVQELVASPILTDSRPGDIVRLTSTPQVLTEDGLRVDGPHTVVSVAPDPERRLLRIRDVEQISAEPEPPRPPVRTARSATGLAAYIAGPTRSHLHDEWSSVLTGFPEGGLRLSPARQRLMTIGFLVAALRMRLRDAARPAWRPIDWLLGTTSRTNGFIATVVGTQAIYIVGHQGLAALMTQVWEPCGIAGASLYALAVLSRDVGDRRHAWSGP